MLAARPRRTACITFAVFGVAAAAKRTCPAQMQPCSPSCLPSEAKRHCRYCKCKACTMCAASGKEDGEQIAANMRGRTHLRSRTQQHATGTGASARPRARPQLGGSRRWVPVVSETVLSSNTTLASKVLRLLGYIPGPQMPLEFGGA
eukprot:1800205-Prymnesium_polylepis.1